MDRQPPISQPVSPPQASSAVGAGTDVEMGYAARAAGLRF